MSKKLCVITNGLLLVWFFFDMFGLSIGKFVLVEGAWKGIDGIWYLIFIGLFLLFCIREKYGKYPLSIFLFLWIFMQFSSHWYFTIFGATEAKLAGYNQFFANTWHIIPASDVRLIPDSYHIVLHLIILAALFCMVSYCFNKGKKYYSK